jgi:hypothetical protein
MTPVYVNVEGSLRIVLGWRQIGMNAVLLVLAVVVAWARFGPYGL